VDGCAIGAKEGSQNTLAVENSCGNAVLLFGASLDCVLGDLDGEIERDVLFLQEV
jgi:hypothetical protein